MKNKPHRHKETNVFKFIPFSERISNVKIDIFHQIKHKYELESDEDTTHFYKAYEKWLLLNGSESFQELRQDITQDIRILPQLLARKDELVKILEKHLMAKNPLNLQPTLEFVVALAHDIRSEFYPYFPLIYKLLMNLLDSKDVEQLEWVFQCLAFLFKLLWRYLINELSPVFESLIPLLDKSKPTYINNFAAQSFAFVARKVKDDSKLIKLIVRTLKDKPEAIEGCGRLVFEIVHGVQGQLHSCGEKIFTSLVLALREPMYPHSILCQLLSQTLYHLIEFLSVREHILLLWKILQTALKDFCQHSKNEPTDRNLANTEQLLCMIQLAVEYKHCKALVDPVPLINQLLDVLSSSESSNLIDHTSSIISYILLNASMLPQALSSSTVLGALECLKDKALLEFALRIKTYYGFEGIVLPRLLKYCLERVPPEVALPYLAQLVISKAPPAEDSSQLIVYQPYSINFSSVRKEDPTLYSTFYLSVLKERNIKAHLEHFDECIMILGLLPHLLPLPKGEAVATIVSLLELACTEMDKNEPSSKELYLLCTMLETIMYLKPETCISKVVPPETILRILINHANEENLFVIRSLDFYLSLDELNLVQPFAEELKTSLYPLLLSPYQKIRLHTAHILYEIEKSEGSNKLMSSVLETCWSAESISPTLATYRHRLKVLQQLDLSSNDTIRNAISKGVVDGRVPLRYLLGQLFVNFKLLWKPVSEIIVGYANAMEAAQFWEVYRGQMECVAAQIREAKQLVERDPFFASKELENHFIEVNSLKEKPDFIKYRIMLWDLLKEFPDTIYEAKSKDIVISFLKFLDEEYTKQHSEAATTWDIRLKGRDEPINVSTHEIDLTMDIDEEQLDLERKEELMDTSSAPIEESSVELETSLIKQDDLKKELTEEALPESEMRSKSLTKSLVAHMGIFGKFRSPKSLYQETELNTIFFKFLSSRVIDVQKCALDFIMQYKWKYLTPYKENVYGLIDDKTFKNELTLFRVDTQSDMIKPEHRAQLIPIVLRLVYSKMYSKVNSSKRENKQARKAAILRFLSGCSNEELFNFIKMTFSNFIDQAEVSATETVSKIIDSFDLEFCTPPRRLTSAVHLLKTMLTYCGGLLNQTQASTLLRIILIVAAHPPAILSKREEVYPGYIKTIKNVKSLCFVVMSQFYEIYENYEWSEDETNAVFRVLVWPYLHNLHIEAVNSPTSQFKLFNTWSKNPKYFVLLGKKDNNGKSVLSAIMELWASPKLHGSVHNTILELIIRLLTDKDEETETSCGKEIFSDFTQISLKLLQDKLNSKKSLTKKELQVLSAITSSPGEDISSECLLSFVLPSLLKSSKKDDEEVTQLLETANNLIVGVREPGPYLRQIVPLFSSLSAPQHRKLLLSLTLNIVKCSELQLDEELLLDLTAWDSKWIEQPDFNRRLKAFIALEQPTLELSPSMAAIVIHIAFYYLKEEKDLSLKDSSRHCLQTMCPRVCLSNHSNKAELGFILNDTIFPLISEGLNSKAEHHRREAILILGHMVRECSSVHYILSDLSPLSNKSDLEVDFFENLVHLQLHRRVRAMLRFSEIAENLEYSWNPRTLMNYVYPMISYYIHNLKYSEKNTIIDSAIKAIGGICRLLPWKYYYTILRNYLGQLKSSTDFQKQNIRIVSEILNVFHFNLSEAGNFNSVKVPKLEEENKEPNENDDAVKLDEAEVAEKNKENLDESQRELPLSKSAAEKVVNELAGIILPNLQSLLVHKNVADSYHKVNKKMISYESNEEDILRAPLAIAIVKLLQKLPSPALLNRNITGVMMKLCTLLKSHGESVRRTVRTTLEAVMTSLGPKYLPTLVSELAGLLTRGFQVHVLAYTVHGVLHALKPMYSKGDMDSCVHLVLEVCKADLFGAAAEEKEVNQITAKTVEARANRSFDIFHILASYASEKYLLDIILPLKEELSQTVSHQIINKATNCLQQVALGLTENQFLEPEGLLELAYGVSTESIPALLAKEGIKKDRQQLEYESRKGADIYLIPDEPKQKKALMSSECSKTNAHILVEFGLKLLFFLLKKEKLKSNNLMREKTESMLDPLVVHLLDCLESQHVKVCTLAVQCLPWMVRLKLSAITKNLKQICNVLFQILHRYASAGLSKGDNFDLVMATFKTVGSLVRDVKSWNINEEDRRILLLYCEQDIEDRERQATAFVLLKALLGRHVKSVELDNVMEKVAALSIKSPIDSVRLQARQVLLTYLMEYALGDVLVQDYLSLFLNNLGYETKDGRESVIEMVHMIIATFPLDFLKKECGYIFYSLSERLVYDKDTDCRVKVGDVISQLLKRLDLNGKDQLFSVTSTWLTDRKLLCRVLGMRLAYIFIDTEKEGFSRRLKQFLSLVVEEMRCGFGKKIPGRFVLRKLPEDIDDKVTKWRMKLLAFETLFALNLALKEFPGVINDNEYKDHIDTILEECQRCLAHSHEWVRVTAVMVIHQIVAAKWEAVTQDLVHDLVGQLRTENGVKVISETIKLLVFIAERVSSDNSPIKSVSLNSLVKNLRMAVNREVVQLPTQHLMRKEYCGWAAALAQKLDRATLRSVASALLLPLVRELNSEITELAEAAKNASGLLKGKLGQAEYSELFSRLSAALEKRKAIRKTEKAQLAVTDPERAAKRKINKQIKKKVFKKRKLELIKEHKFKKKEKKTEIDLGDN